MCTFCSSPHHQRGVHLLGRNGYADYLNLVYREFDPAAASLVIRRVAEDFGTRDFLMERLVAGSSSREWFARQPGATLEEHEAVQVEVPQSEEAYTRMLSKSTRQNIRTAWNRSRKDGVTLRVEWTQAPVEDEAASELALLKKTREANRSRLHRGVVPGLRAALRTVIFSALFTPYNEAHEAVKRITDPWVMRVSANERLCAFAFGIPDQFGGARVLRVLQVGYDEAFARYSPGLLGLHTFISDQAARQRPDFDIIDFTRGGERYKYELGAPEPAWPTWHSPSAKRSGSPDPATQPQEDEQRSYQSMLCQQKDALDAQWSGKLEDRSGGERLT